MFVGETNYCARLVQDPSFISLSNFTFFHKKINPGELRSNIISLVIRATVQLDQLGFSFQKKKNTRIVELQRQITIHFYIYQNDFYATMTCPGEPTTDETSLVAILHNILQDTSRPLYRTMTPHIDRPEVETITPSWRLQVPVFEVEEDEEPPYKKRRTDNSPVNFPAEPPVFEVEDSVETELEDGELSDEEEPPYKYRRQSSM
jgi:hypothetical protein